MGVSRVPFLGLLQNPSQVSQTGGLAPSQKLTSMEQSQSIFTDKYGPNSIDPTSIPVSREQYRNGLNPMQFEPLGENAINGKIGANLNIKA